MFEEDSSCNSSTELDCLDLNTILTQEEHLLPLEDLLQRLPIKYHKALIKLFKEKSECLNLYFKGFSINRCNLKAEDNTRTDQYNKITRLGLEDTERLSRYEMKIQSSINDFKFNDFQIYAINKMLGTKNKNFLISAPTAGGKTYLALFSFFRYGKLIYVVPLKALIADLCEFFNKFNLRIKINCGDEISNEWREFDILLVTPEKVDLLISTNPFSSSNRNKYWLNKVKVLILDEIHILNDSRGPVIELIYTKLAFLKCNIKIVALSATIANIDNLCNFLGAELIEYNGFRKHDVILDYITNITISEYEIIFHILKNLAKNEEKILIFVDSRIETYKLLCNIFVNLKNFSLKNQLKKKSIMEFYEKYFKEITEEGFFIHHGGLKSKDKRINKDWKLIVSTNTLAWGVNINPDLIIIKSEFDYLNIIQMKGRVGRIKKGRAIIFKQKLPHLIIESRMSENFEFWLLNYINFLGATLFQDVNEEGLKSLKFEGEFEYKMFLFYISKYKLVSNKHIKVVYKKDLIVYLSSWYKDTFSFYCKDALDLEILSIIEKYKNSLFIPILLDNRESIIISPLLNISYGNGFSVNAVIKIYKEMNCESTLKNFLNSLMCDYPLYKDFLNPQLNEYNNCDNKTFSNENLYELLKRNKIEDTGLIKYILRYLEIYKEISIFKQNSDILVEILTFKGKYLTLGRKDLSKNNIRTYPLLSSHKETGGTSKKVVKKEGSIKFNEKGELKFSTKPPIFFYVIIFSSGKIEKYQIVKRNDIKNNILLLENRANKRNILVLDNCFKIIFKNFLIN